MSELMHRASCIRKAEQGPARIEDPSELRVHLVNASTESDGQQRKTRVHQMLKCYIRSHVRKWLAGLPSVTTSVVTHKILVSKLCMCCIN